MNMGSLGPGQGTVGQGSLCSPSPATCIAVTERNYSLKIKHRGGRSRARVAWEQRLDSSIQVVNTLIIPVKRKVRKKMKHNTLQ